MKWMENSWGTSWWMPKLIRWLWLICPRPKLVNGTVCNPSINICWNVWMRRNCGSWSECQAEIRSLWHSTWRDTLWVQIDTRRNWLHFVKVFMWWCNALCDSTVLVVTGYMDIQETCIVERTYDEEIHKGINHSLREKDFCAEGKVQKKMLSESIEFIRKTTGFFTNSWRISIVLESHFEEHAQEVWERHWINPEMQTTSLNTSLPKKISTILKALREQLKESDQLHSVEEIAGPVPQIPLEYDQILRGGRFWDNVNGVYLPEDLVLAAEREDIDWVQSESVLEIVPMQEWRDAGLKPLDLILGGCRHVCGSDTQKKSFEFVGKRLQNEVAREDSTSSTSFSLVLSSANSRSCEGSCLNRAKGNHWSWDITTSAEQTSAEQPRDLLTSNFFQRIVRRMTKTKLADWSRACAELKTLPTSGNLASWTWSVESQEASEEANTVPNCFTIRIKTWEWQCTAMILRVCQMTLDSNTSTVFSNPNTQRKTWEHLDSKIQTWKAFCCWIVCSELESIKLDSTWTLNLTRHTTHHWIRMQHEHRKSEHTARTQKDKLVSDRRRSPILKRDEATSCRSACMRTFMLGPREIWSCWNRNIFPR